MDNEENVIQQIKEKWNILQIADMLDMGNIRDVEITQKVRCPRHEDRHPSLVLQPDVNRFHCLSCDFRGDMFDLFKEIKHWDYKEAFEHFKEKEPKQVPILPEKYLHDKRGLTDETIKKFGLWINKDAIVIPLPTGEKYRSVNPVGKHDRYWAKTGTEGCIFKTKEATKQVILVEGEFDSMIFWQNTDFPVWTLTTGKATDMKKYLEKFVGIEKIWIAYDSDDPGEQGATQVAETLGAERCYRMKVPVKYGKDWTDFFTKGGDLKEVQFLLRTAKPYLEKLSDVFEKQLSESFFRVKSGVAEIDDEVQGFRSSNAYIVAGLEKSGKSSLLMQFLNHMISDGTKVGYINTEFRLQEFGVRMAAINTERTKQDVDFNPDLPRDWFEKYQDQLLYAGIEGDDLREGNVLSLEKTMQTLNKFADQGMQVLMFDNITSFANSASKKQQSWEVLSNCISQLITFAKERNIVVFLVIHQKQNTIITESPQSIRKMIEDGRPEDIFDMSMTLIRRPSIGDLFGGGAALSQVSGVVFVWRPYQKFKEAHLQEITRVILESFRHSQGGNEIKMLFNGEIGLFRELDFDAPF